MDSPHLVKIKQLFPENALADVKEEVLKELTVLRPFVKPGASIGLAVGSRGVANLAEVVRTVAEYVKEAGADPFIIPAMGSHGDATAEGQAAILEDYGVSEKTMGIPVRSTLEVVEIPHGDLPVPLFMDKYAHQSDGVILINRIKPHTDFHARYESGLVKMCVIGLGNEKQASAIHGFGVYGLSTLIPLAAERILSTGKIIGGIGMVENALDETMLVKAIRAEEILDQEPGLLEIARKNMPALPVREIDVLIIDRMGKEISGAGMDTNIIGRIRIAGQDEPEQPAIKAIVVLELTEASHGNAIGVGLSDVISRRLYDKIDFSATYTNAVASSFLERAKIPVVAGTDREAFEIALRSCGYIGKGDEKIVRIKDTLHLAQLYVSKAVMDILEGSERIRTLEDHVTLFTSENEITPF